MQRRPAIRTLHGWAISVLQQAGAIRGMQDRADPYARERAFEIARQDLPIGISPGEAVVEIQDVLESMRETCPECPTDT